MGDKASQPASQSATRPRQNTRPWRGAVDDQLPLHNSVKVALDWRLARQEEHADRVEIGRANTDGHWDPYEYI